MKYYFVFILICFTGFLSACSTRQIIRNSEYQYSEAAFRSGDLNQALERFPTKEEGGFVTSIEKSWLGLWNGERDHSDLMKQVKTLDQRNYTSVLRETQYFFYNESEDGYIPAEHEIIIMHMLNAMYFMRAEQWDEARVEARQAVFFLQNYFKEDQSHFDDPALRIWMAGIWAALGEWDDAQVDLRKAYELSRDKKLLPLLALKKAPSNMSVIFDGSGPKIIWKEGELTPSFQDESTPPQADIVKFRTLPWFLRHEKRNSEIRNVVMKSNYMAQYYGLNTNVGAQKSLGFVAGTALRITGVMVGTAIIAGGIYALAASGASGGSGDVVTGIFVLGLGTGSYIWKSGDKVQKMTYDSADETKTDGLENLRTYRFVRFMPSWISVTDTDEFVGLIAKSFKVQAPKSKTKVLFLQRF